MRARALRLGSCAHGAARLPGAPRPLPRIPRGPCGPHPPHRGSPRPPHRDPRAVSGDDADPTPRGSQRPPPARPRPAPSPRPRPLAAPSTYCSGTEWNFPFLRLLGGGACARAPGCGSRPCARPWPATLLRGSPPGERVLALDCTLQAACGASEACRLEGVGGPPLSFRSRWTSGDHGLAALARGPPAARGCSPAPSRGRCVTLGEQLLRKAGRHKNRGERAWCRPSGGDACVCCALLACPTCCCGGKANTLTLQYSSDVSSAH